MTPVNIFDHNNWDQIALIAGFKILCTKIKSEIAPKLLCFCKKKDKKLRTQRLADDQLKKIVPR